MLVLQKGKLHHPTDDDFQKVLNKETTRNIYLRPFVRSSKRTDAHTPYYVYRGNTAKDKQNIVSCSNT